MFDYGHCQPSGAGVTHRVEELADTQGEDETLPGVVITQLSGVVILLRIQRSAPAECVRYDCSAHQRDTPFAGSREETTEIGAPQNVVAHAIGETHLADERYTQEEDADLPIFFRIDILNSHE